MAWHWPSFTSSFRRRRRKPVDAEWLHANVPRRRESTGRERWIMAGVLSALLLTAAGLFYYFHFRHNPQFLLRDLSIVSGEMVSDGLIRGLILNPNFKESFNTTKPVFLFGPDIEEVHERLLQYPGIRSVTITRRLPSRLDVRIVEREPIGRIRSKNDELVVDADGMVFPRNAGVDHLPRIDGFEGIPVQTGGRLDGMGLAAVHLLAAIQRPDMALPVAAVDVSHTDYLNLTLRDHRQVRLWWKGMDAPNGSDEARETLSRRLKRLLQAMALAPQRQVWDATVPDDNRIFSPY